jgi:hypothetical protein
MSFLSKGDGSMLLLDYIGKPVNILEGENSGESGTFIRDIAYTGWAGLICSVDINGVIYHLPTDYFIFQDYDVQMCFEAEDCNRI